MNRRCLFIGVAVAACVGSAGLADDYLTTQGRLSNEDFYHLVACRAAPGQACSDRIVQWSAANAMRLGVGIASVAEGYPPELAREMSRGIDRVITTLNGADAALRLERATKSSQAGISIHLIGAGQGGIIQGTGNNEMDGVSIGAALVHIRWNLSGDITRGTIALASDIPQDEAFPILLEEITQSLGLMTDIRSPYYRDISVFSEDSNEVDRFSDQDLYAIRRHYPNPDTPSPIKPDRP